jgi:hypothetical protein
MAAHFQFIIFVPGQEHLSASKFKRQQYTLQQAAGYHYK